MNMRLMLTEPIFPWTSMGFFSSLMSLNSKVRTVALVTAHVPLREVAPMLATGEIVRVGNLLAAFLHSLPLHC